MSGRRERTPDPQRPSGGAVTADGDTGLEEPQAPRSHLRDLAALLALPAMWRGRAPPHIAENLLDVLVSILRVDVAYVRLDRTEDDPAIEAWRPHGHAPPHQAAEALQGDLMRGAAMATTSEPDPLGSGLLRVAGLHLRHLGQAGLVVVGSRRTDFPSETERFLLAAAVEQAAIAIDTVRALRREQAARAEAEALAAGNARLLREAREQADVQVELNAALREEREALAVINRVGQALSAELDLRRLVQAVTDAATELTGAQFGAFFYNVTDERGEAYQLYTLSGAPPEVFTDFPLPRATELFGPTFRGEGVIRLDDVTKDPRYGRNAPYHGKPPGHLPVVSYLAAPVVSRSGKVLGGLFFGHSEPGVFTERAEHITSGLAAQAAVAMDNALLYQQAQEAVKTRDDFLAAAAHDLRTPLAAMKGMAQLRRRQALRAGASESEPLLEALAQVEASANKMAKLIDEMVDVTRLRVGRALELRPQSTDLVALARRAVAEHQRLSETPDIRMETAESELVGLWDGARLERVLDNLLDNAVKYSPEGGEIAVRVARAEDAAGVWAVLAVRDRGLGIPAADLPRIFERFHRGENVAGRIAGTGIGLAGVRHIVEQHGGSIAVDSREGTGSTFTVRLPLVSERADAADPDR